MRWERQSFSIKDSLFINYNKNCKVVYFVDYFVIDVTKLFRHPTSKSVTSVDADDLSFAAVAKYGKTTHLHSKIVQKLVAEQTKFSLTLILKLSKVARFLVELNKKLNIKHLFTKKNENPVF